jgi:hypothetical protein
MKKLAILVDSEYEEKLIPIKKKNGELAIFVTILKYVKNK